MRPHPFPERGQRMIRAIRMEKSSYGGNLLFLEDLAQRRCNFRAKGEPLVRKSFPENGERIPGKANPPREE